VQNLYTQSGVKRLLEMQLANAQLTLCLHQLTATLAAVAAAIDALRQGIEQRAAEDPRMQLAMACLPSIGAVSALTIISELGDASRFRNAKAVASSGGLVPRVYQSADTAHHGRLTKRGNRGLRFILGQWAVRLMSRQPEVIAWARQRRKRQHVNKVRMALARKLLIGVWIMLTRGEDFDLQRCLAA
jgi:transposase